MSKGAYAHGTLPGMRELVKVVDENKALQGEVQRLRAEIERSQSLLTRCLPYIEPEVEQSGYGFFPGGDPTKFVPDEDNSPEEIENWKEACKRWNETKQGEEGSHRWLTDGNGNVVGTATIARLGMGMYTYENEEAKELATVIRGLAGLEEQKDE